VDVFALIQYGAKGAAVTELMMWSNFAKIGNPATDDVAWPLYTNENDTFVEIGPGTGASVKTGLKPL